MKQSILKTTVACLVISSLFISLSACDSQHTVKDNKRTIDTGAISANAQLSGEEKAERLALAAEELLTPDGFIYATDVLDEALKHDSNNKRAQLYRSLMEQTLALKGILKRVTPLMNQYPHLKEQHQLQIKNMENTTVMNAYLLDGQEDIKSEEDVQTFLDSFYEKQEAFRQFLIKNKDLEITLNYSAWLKEVSYTTEQKCKVFRAPNGQYELFNCENYKPVSVKLNRADNETLQQYLAGGQITTILATAYKINGLARQLDIGLVAKASAQSISSNLLANSESAKLRSTNRLLNILTFGTDGIAAIQWAKSSQKTLCNDVHPDLQERPGMLFFEGLCLSKYSHQKKTALDQISATVASAISGQHILARSGTFETTVNPNVLITQPIQDLKKLKPRFDVCDQLVNLDDKSVGGLFVKKDAVAFLNFVNDDCGPRGRSNAQ